MSDILPRIVILLLSCESSVIDRELRSIFLYIMRGFCKLENSETSKKASEFRGRSRVYKTYNKRTSSLRYQLILKIPKP